MKTLSVLLTFALLFAADRLLSHMERKHELPVNTARPADGTMATGLVSRFQVRHSNNETL